MGELQYSIFRYAPSIVSGEKINIAALFYDVDSGYRELFVISKWGRVSAFDDTLNIPLVKALMRDIKEEIGTQIDTPDFNIKKFCAQYDSELYFDKCESLIGVKPEELEDEIENIKKMYFQFEYDPVKRPKYGEQKQFLRRLLVSKQIQYRQDSTTIGKFDAEIKYDYIFGNCGVVLFNFNTSKIDNKIMNRVKAWAWNAQNKEDNLKLIILYDLEDQRRTEVKPALEILSEVATKMINIHDGFSGVVELIDKDAS